jgi:hypothetical protein
VGSRNYNFSPAIELLYHALTEAGPGLIIMILFAHKIKIIDISEYSDDGIGLPPVKSKKKPGKDKRKRIDEKPDEDIEDYEE